MSFYPVQCPSIGFFKKSVKTKYHSEINYETNESHEPEHFASKKAIVFLTVNPQLELIRFAEKLNQGYDVYITVDNNEYEIPEHQGVTFLKYKEGVAEHYGYKGCVLWVPDRASSRCKSLYHFGNVDKSYDYVWMIEEDVFIPSKKTISHLDNLYPDGDLLCTDHIINSTGELKSWPWWEKIKDKTPLPWAKSMISSIRVSRALLNEIDTHANQSKSLLFDETLFNTIAMHAQLKITTPPELNNIVYWHRQWDVNEFKPFHMYHPMKQWKDHHEYKDQMGMEYYSNMDVVFPKE